ncbi:MAG: hypothetical protein KIS87_09245 [Phycisphaeraceae bacterium]|nr:hypothetical protein [Phycisphaeraceae bacterium]
MECARQIAALTVVCALGTASVAQVSDPVGPPPVAVVAAQPDAARVARVCWCTSGRQWMARWTWW